MAGFDAGNVVEAMDWDFTKYKAGKGTVPEPSDVELERFLRKYRVLVTSVMQAAGVEIIVRDNEMIELKPDGVTRTQALTMPEAIKLMGEIDLEKVEESSSYKISDAMLDLVVTITKGKPSKQQLLKLPNRIRGAFFGWLIGQLTNPDFGPAVDTSPSLALVNGG